MVKMIVGQSPSTTNPTNNDQARACSTMGLPDVDHRVTVALDAACELRTLIRTALDNVEEVEVICCLLRRATVLADGCISALDDEVSAPAAIEARLWQGVH
jgi:hypothetical protein